MPPCIQKRNAYSASLQSRSKDPHSTERERATDARKFLQHVIPQTHTIDVTLAALEHTGCHDDTLHTLASVRPSKTMHRHTYLHQEQQ